MINNLRFLGRMLPLGIFIFICLEANAQQIALVDKGLLSKPGYYQSNTEVYLMDVISALANKYKVKINYDAEIVAGKKLPSNLIKNGESTVELELEQILKPFNLKFEKFGKDSYAIFPQSTNQKEIKTIEKSGLNERTPTESNELKNLGARKSDLTLEKREVAITGTVTSDTGEPLPGVNVVLKGTGIGAATDINGKYTLKLKSAEGILVFSFLGYVSEEMAINGQTTIDLAMFPDIKTLGEIVVVGYGTQKKTDLTGSVVSVSSKDFNAGQNTTPEQMIMGKVPGVQITSNSGAPGAGSTIKIRGTSTLSANGAPLIVLDGVPLDNNGVSGTANGLSSINPNDIETFTILKDASATAIYGSRASNGVIIITTKKGKAGDKLSVGFSSLVSMSKIKNTLEMLSGDEFRSVVNNPVYQQGANASRLGKENTDWQSLIFRNAITYDNNISLTGSLKALPYRVSVGYMNQQGVLLTSNLKRTSGSISLNPTLLNDHLKVNLNLKGINMESRFGDESAIGNAAYFDPTQDPYNAANSKYGGYFEWLQGGSNSLPISLAPKNPLSALQQVNNTSSAQRSIGNIQLDYKLHFFPDLKANLNVGYDISSSKGSAYSDTSLASVSPRGSQYKYSQEKSNNVFDFYLNYTKDLKGINSRIDIMGGYSYQSFLQSEPSYPILTYLRREAPLKEDTISFANTPAKIKNVLVSFFGRLNYSLKDRYLLTATIRQDGTSRFSPESRWGLFPSVALGWRINKESFLEGSGFISDLKLRASAGVTGMQDLGTNNYYPYLARYTQGNFAGSYQFGNNYFPTLRPEGYDYNIKWEETTTYNVGLDYGILGGRISGTFDYYIRNIQDMLGEIPIAAGSNLTNLLTTNVGTMENKGVEASINVNLVSTEKTKWSIGFNASYNQNKITNLSKTEDNDPVGTPVGGIGIGNSIQVHTVGHPAYSFYVYKQVYDEAGKPVEGLYADMNKDGIVNSSDLYRYKKPDPNVFLGFNSQINIGQFNMGFVMRASFGNYMYNRNDAGAYYKNISYGGYMINIPASVMKSNFLGANVLSDYYIENASFLRMDNINIGYNLGKIFNDKLTLRLSGVCQNVFVITKYSGLDPEIGGGIDGSIYPRSRTYSVGLNVGF